MLTAIQSDDGENITLLIVVEIRDADGAVIERLPEAEYPINAVPEGSLTPKEIDWIHKIYPNAVITFRPLESV